MLNLIICRLYLDFDSLACTETGRGSLGHVLVNASVLQDYYSPDNAIGSMFFQAYNTGNARACTRGQQLKERQCVSVTSD